MVKFDNSLFMNLLCRIELAALGNSLMSEEDNGLEDANTFVSLNLRGDKLCSVPF